ncbi:hypothetical protein ACQKII_07435 [Lysinibacillus sp. NPDC048646]|uniref:hypothetical protein n=1 Tax=Lysinibacillus sp. NPDC048646 TaxID=3390574 RepID=UPI003D08CBBF
MKKHKFEDANKESGFISEELTASKVEVISSIILTLGYSLSTLATILALQEEEEAAQLKTSYSQDQSQQFKQMCKQLQYVNDRLDSIERKLDRY